MKAIIIILMNNLASLKSELLLEYTEETQSHWRTRNFYQHHTLPPRAHIKSSQARNKPPSTSARLNFLIPTEKSSISKLDPQSSRTIGRNLFSNPQKEKVPGPGSYESPLKRHSSCCYIKKEENHLLHKIERKLRRRQMINECRGPGLYNPEKAFNHTSRSLSVKQTKMFPGDFTRAVLPKKKENNLYLATTLSQLKLENKEEPAPNTYDIQKLGFKTSNFVNFPTHKISNTQRSNIAKVDSLPGPGFYNWSSIYQRKNSQAKGKPSIQFKFVYGHPS